MTKTLLVYLAHVLLVLAMMRALRRWPAVMGPPVVRTTLLGLFFSADLIFLLWVDGLGELPDWHGLAHLAYFAYVLFIWKVSGPLAAWKPLSGRPVARLALPLLLVLAGGFALLWIDDLPHAAARVGPAMALALSFVPRTVVGPLDEWLASSKSAVYFGSVATILSMVCLHLPITTFLTSPGEIGIHLDNLLALSLDQTVLVVYVAAAIYGIAWTRHARAILACVAFVSLLVALAYSFVHPFGYPLMNGLVFEQIPIASAQLVLRAAADVATVAACLAGGLVLLRRAGSRRVLWGLGVVNVSLIIASAWTASRDAGGGAGGESARAAPSGPLLRYSQDQRNVLVLFLDRFMGGFVEGILEREPGLRRELSGFTWYPNTVAAGRNSAAGVHPLLGGYDYTPREMNKRGLPLRDVAAESYAILPRNFTAKGYHATLLNPRGLGFTMRGDCSALAVPEAGCVHIPASVARRKAEADGMPLKQLSDANYADLLYLLGLMRAAPYSLKEILARRGPWRPFMDMSAGTTFQQWAELGALRDLSTAGVDRPQLNVVFNMLPHEPYYLGADCRPKQTRLEPGEEEMRQTGFSNSCELQHFNGARCTLLLTADYFRWMKQAGVYDNTKIVIVSDHGIADLPVEDRSSRARLGGTTGSLYVNSRSVLLVKETNAGGDIRTSDEFLPNAEVPRIACQEIGGCTNPYLGGKPIQALGRDDPFLVDFVPWQFTQQRPTEFKIEREFSLRNRNAYDARNWREESP